MKYLGHLISEDGVRPDITRVQLFENFVPDNRKSVMKILGFVNWYRPYFKNATKSTMFLSDKTKKNIKFSWTGEDQEALAAVLEEIRQQTLLSYPDLNTSFILETDASDLGLGGILR